MLSHLQADIQYTFKEIKYLKIALTHSSYSNENSSFLQHNERLEFLGDAVLELATSKILFERYLDMREGELTAMRAAFVSQPSLAEVARKLKINQYILLGNGEESQGGRERDALLCDAFEAVLGAVFLDSGFESIMGVVSYIYEKYATSSVKEEKSDKNYKSLLQEMSQKKYKERPSYNLVNSFGPEHDKKFEVEISMPDGKKYKAIGSSVKRAEQLVASLAVEDFRE